MRTRSMLEAAGTALLLLFADYLPFFHPQNHDLFHHGLPVGNLVGGLLLDLTAVTAFVFAALIAIHWVHQPLQKYCYALTAAGIAWVAIDRILEVLSRLRYPAARYEQAWENGLLIVLALACGVMYLFPESSLKATRAIRFATAAAAFSGLWIVPHLLYIGFVLPAPETARVAAIRTQGNADLNRRIVWILFDELSYDQTFEHRLPGIQLPNFDKFRSESDSFSHLKPAGYYTDRIIPSLLLGKTISEYRSTVAGRYFYRETSRGPWIAFDPEATLFAEAAQYGWNPAVDGWYNPYCSMLGTLLTACHWTRDNPTPLEEYGASEANSAFHNAFALKNQLSAAVLERETTEADIHLSNYRELIEQAHPLIGDERLRFVFIHLPIPHPPGIYDRQQHLLRRSGSYLDNLVLTDDTLGELLKQVGATGSGDQTTVIVSSDHSWRVRMYQDRRDWTQEEQAASGGRFDDRPVLLIHFPGQHSARDVSAPLPEMLEHDMIAAILAGHIRDKNQMDDYITNLTR